mgnify:CR=1 FL=1
MHIQVTKWKKLGLALSILIILNVFFNVGIDTFYKMPQYDKYCPQDLWVDQPTDATTCAEEGGMWRDDPYMESKTPQGVAIKGYCDVSYTCNQTYNDDLSVYNRNTFIILTALGAVTIVVSIFLTLPSAVASGLLYGGVLSLIIGTMRYWGNMDEYLRFAVSGIVLLVLVLIGIRKMKD